ncbi:MAG TPA: hypothetical protein VFM05_02390 [Candidatus Saccharimonadales bacterium]|nr:hypothetical protein [Candidatus Saccharimonadales bacterium]
MSPQYIHLANGNYLGFIHNSNLFSRDGIYLGWVDHDGTVWDKNGHYRGKVTELNGGHYIFRHRFAVAPIPRVPKVRPATPAVPAPAANKAPIIIPLPYEDAFDGFVVS